MRPPNLLQKENDMLASFVELPGPIVASITGLVVGLFALLFNFLIARYPWLEFLRKYQQEWALGLAALLVDAIQNWIPELYGKVAITGIEFLLAVIALFVVYIAGNKLFASRKVVGFK